MNKALEEEPHFKFSVIFEKKKKTKKKNSICSWKLFTI